MTTKPYMFDCLLVLADEQKNIIDRSLGDNELTQTQVGEHAFINQMSVRLEQPLPEDTLIEYDLHLTHQDERLSLSSVLPEILYDGRDKPNFIIKQTLENILHGSCRKPHSPCEDGLTEIDLLFMSEDLSMKSRPSLLMLSGDQVYVDDVSGPMLSAVHQVIERLGLFNETWQNDSQTTDAITTSLALFEHPNCYYQRHLFLPKDRVNKTLFERVFAASKKPVFTSVNARNHLVSLSEMIAMYFLSWSPTLWKMVDYQSSEFLRSEFKNTYQQELKAITKFVDELTPIRRALAHIPTYMIFDDHDVTDDWNLTRGWKRPHMSTHSQSA